MEITVDDAFRYISFKLVKSQVQVDRFPVARGTVIPVADNEALLWVYGSAAALRNKLALLPGQATDPGTAGYPPACRLDEPADPRLASEILGLSKVNWNTFDLYTQVPGTAETSNKIARIGGLMEAYG